MFNTSVINGPLPTGIFTAFSEMSVLKNQISSYGFKVEPSIGIPDDVPDSDQT